MQQPKKPKMVMSESGKPQRLSDRTARAKAMAAELNKIAAERVKKGGPMNLSQWPSKGLTKKK